MNVCFARCAFLLGLWLVGWVVGWLVWLVGWLVVCLCVFCGRGLCSIYVTYMSVFVVYTSSFCLLSVFCVQAFLEFHASFGAAVRWFAVSHRLALLLLEGRAEAFLRRRLNEVYSEAGIFPKLGGCDHKTVRRWTTRSMSPNGCRVGERGGNTQPFKDVAKAAVAHVKSRAPYCPNDMVARDHLPRPTVSSSWAHHDRTMQVHLFLNPSRM